jgi:RNA polymerase subunit RPABC4/transcription elongation factor Spt4
MEFRVGCRNVSAIANAETLCRNPKPNSRFQQWFEILTIVRNQIAEASNGCQNPKMLPKSRTIAEIPDHC